MSTMVECVGLWKSYHRNHAVGIKELLLGRRPRHDGRFAREWALQNVSFSVPKGTAFGIIGHNGTGKSTLLSLLLGTILPDRGKVKLNGRVASLLELGAGFHPELTGRQNVFLYGSILGMTISEIKERLPAIEEFSELNDAIDEPIRTYSNGMVTRLGFSTIIHAPADILLIDEVLAVGDARFQAKCRTYLRDFKRRNGTLVVVSHDMKELEEVCDEGICLNMGRIVKTGHISDVIRHYRSSMEVPAA